MTYDSIPSDQLRETLNQLIHNFIHSGLHNTVQAEIERAAIAEFDGPEHSHRYENIAALDAEIAFNSKRLEIAKAKLAELD